MTRQQVSTFIVKRIERQEDIPEGVLSGPRTLLFGHGDSYHLIAPLDVSVHVGDTVEYEPKGMNFGYFVKVLKSKELKIPFTKFSNAQLALLNDSSFHVDEHKIRLHERCLICDPDNLDELLSYLKNSKEFFLSGADGLGLDGAREGKSWAAIERTIKQWIEKNQ
jgi:hypothetical protein